MHTDKNIETLYTLTLEQVGAAADEITPQSISACLDYLIWTVDSAASEEDLRAAKLLLEKSIEAYVDQVTSRIADPTVFPRA